MLSLFMKPTSVAVQKSSPVDSTAIRHFEVHFPQAKLDELRRRILATQWPEKETVPDQLQGVPLAAMQKLAHYWATDYDWRKAEATLNALPQYVTVKTQKCPATDHHPWLAWFHHRATEGD